MNRPFGKVCYTTRDAARALDVSPSTVANWIDAGHLPGHRTAGGHRRIPAEALEALVARLGMPGPTTSAPAIPVRDAAVPAPGRPRLLIVDADADFGATVGNYMTRKFDWSVGVATTAFEAGVEAARAAPDAVLLDVRHGDTEGLCVFDALRADASFARVRVYACTGWRDPEVDRRIRHAGFAGCFYKPVDLSTLGAVLARDHAPRPASGVATGARAQGARWTSGAR